MNQKTQSQHTTRTQHIIKILLCRLRLLNRIKKACTQSLKKEYCQYTIFPGMLMLFNFGEMMNSNKRRYRMSKEKFTFLFAECARADEYSSLFQSRRKREHRMTT